MQGLGSKPKAAKFNQKHRPYFGTDRVDFSCRADKYTLPPVLSLSASRFKSFGWLQGFLLGRILRLLASVSRASYHGYHPGNRYRI